jgi:hypothetical protein
MTNDPGRVPSEIACPGLSADRGGPVFDAPSQHRHG